MAIQTLIFLWRFCVVTELDLLSRYGAGSWVAITGADGGMGKLFAQKFARRGFNVLLIGFERCNLVAEQIREEYGVEARVVVKDFSKAWQPDFFVEIEDAFRELDLSVLVNNVASRKGWIPSHSQPAEDALETICCGTVVQARLSQMAISKFVGRDAKLKSAVIFMTALLVFPNFGLSVPLMNTVHATFLSVYEASNAFGYFHAMSLCDEYLSPIYNGRIDMLNITPGAVVGENTQVLLKQPFHATANRFVDQTLAFLGNVQGAACASVVHVVAMALGSVFPLFYKNGP
eukprot:CAMPEP_0197696422 /NCGR_PEP_ID=MMETSP1338-20131121/116604_1 /TAXON_ID=43686 ORGANISM="Pelagodinium beii, Strain RCC1491" /NCGR_SAMPLE_ID=MMETSP1338 /ASSEMBLY_ACC=CAM_ASM_000754 /LENGTH=288 /DNA_ID=CAMNT_0043279533 /DNA_START=89 /DNA_END=951 /DNA_ORIENTATION=-